MVGFSRLGRAGLMAAAALATLTLAACSDYVGKIPKHLAPLDASTRALVDKKGMEQKAPILIRLFKEESSLEVWKQQKATGKYALLKDYKICAWSGVLGPKLKEGDRQAPEGFYNIRPAQMNPNSSYHLSFNIGFPNEFDRSYGRTGSDLMVHGACSSRGCYSMTDEQIQEIYTLGRLAFEGGQRDFQVQAFPFRMTPENMAKHRGNPNMPFWRMLKEGYDHFELIRQPPKVDVCDRRYVFNSVPAEGKAFRATSACPPMMMPEEIRVAVGKRDAEHNAKMLKLAAKLDRKERSASASILEQALLGPTTVALAAPMSVPAESLSLEPAAVASIPAEPGGASPTAGSASDGQPVMTSSIAPAAPSPQGSSERSTAEASAAALPTPSPAAAPAGADPAVASATVAAPPKAEPAGAPQPSPAAEVAALPEPAAPPAEPVGEASAPAEVAEEAAPISAEPSLGAIAAAPKKPATAPAADAQAAATLEERMGAGSAAPDPGAASAYAPVPANDEGLTGFVLRMFE